MELKELIPFLEENKTSIKLHFARGSKVHEEPLLEFLSGSFKEWQEYQRNNNFGRDYIVSLISLGNKEWLFGGIYHVSGFAVKKDGHYQYKTELTDYGKDLVGRAVIYYDRQFRQSYCCLERLIDDLDVIEIRRSSFTLPFPGYDKTCVSWMELKTVINSDSWKTAMQNQKGVYLITDKSNGKMYVGSAIGNDMLWGRMNDYVKTGHGNNKELKTLKFDHIKQYFQYTILDTYKSDTDDELIIEREQWWKNVLMTREFGYNKN